MSSRMAERIAVRADTDRVRRASGLMPSVGQWMASRAVAMTVLNWGELPDDAADGNLQTETGEFKFLVGYSALGGPDVVG